MQFFVCVEFNFNNNLICLKLPGLTEEYTERSQRQNEPSVSSYPARIAGSHGMLVLSHVFYYLLMK